jgi:ligand-binding sensor protein
MGSLGQDAPIPLELLVAPERLAGLQETYTAALGLAASIIAPGGRRITPETNRRRLCSLLCASEGFRVSCHHNDLEAIRADGPGATIYRTECCRLVDVAIPLSVGSSKAGTFLSGLVRTAPLAAGEAAAIVDEYLDRDPALSDRVALEDAVRSVPVVDVEVLRATASLLSEFADHIADLAERTLLEGELRETQRRARSASRAHLFMAGSLNTLADLAVLEHAADAHALVVVLARMLRYAADPDPLATIADEVEHALDYLRVRQAGFGDELRYEARLDPAVNDLPLPRLCLRILVDELLRSHLESSEPDVPVTIGARHGRTGVVVEVRVRSGPAGGPAELADMRHGLERVLGPGALLSARDVDGVRCVGIRLPLGDN